MSKSSHPHSPWCLKKVVNVSFPRDSAAEGFIKPRKPLHPDSADSMVFEAKPTPEETMQLQLADDESTDNSSTEDADNASECDDEGKAVCLIVSPFYCLL